MTLSAQLYNQQIGKLSYFCMLEYIQHSKQHQEEEAAHTYNLTKHRLVEDKRIAVTRLVFHHALGWRQGGESHGCEGVHDEVYPQHLRNHKRRLRAHESAAEDKP